MKGRFAASLLCCLASSAMMSGSARAAWTADAQTCFERRYDLRIVIDACTRALGSGLLAGDQIAKTYNNRGLAYYDNGDDELAIKDFDQALKLLPNLAEAFVNRALANSAINRFGAALQDYEQALKIEPGNVDALLNRGTQYLNSSEPALAEKDLRRVLQLQPKNATAAKRLELAVERLRLIGDDKSPRVLTTPREEPPTRLEAKPAPVKPATPPPAPVADAEESAARIKRAQSLLGQLAKLQNEPSLSAGAADGKASRKTIAAVEQFQRRSGEPVTGEIDASLIETLEAALVTARAESERLKEEQRVKLAAEQEKKAEEARQRQQLQQAADAERKRQEEQAQLAAAAERKRQEEVARAEAQAVQAERRRREQEARLAELERKRLEELAQAEAERRRAEEARAEAVRLLAAQTEQAIKAKPAVKAEAPPAFEVESPVQAQMRPPSEVKPADSPKSADAPKVVALYQPVPEVGEAEAPVPMRAIPARPLIPDNGTRVALVIGNASYKKAPKLDNPLNDAADVAAALRQIGFRVLLGEDADRNAMDELTIRFRRAARDAEVALVFYAGHGIQVNGRNYLLPTDSELVDDADLRRTVRLDDIVDDAGQAKKLSLVVVDACRDNPLAQQLVRNMAAQRIVGARQGLAQPGQFPQQMMIAFSTQADTTAEDGTGNRNSPFTEALLRHLTKPGLEIRQMFGKVIDDVKKATRNRQLPAKFDSLGGDDVFLIPPPTDIALDIDDLELKERQALLQSLRQLGHLQDDNVNAPSGLLKNAIATFQRSQGFEVTNGRLTAAQLVDLHNLARWKRPRLPLPAVNFTELIRKGRNGDVEALVQLGQIYDPSYMDGPVQKDGLEAVYYYEQAASKGNAVAAAQLGLIYKDGLGSIDPDTKKAIEWLRKAAEKGNSRAQYGLAELFRDGKGIAKDEGSARQWFERAAAQPDGGVAIAQLRILGAR